MRITVTLSDEVYQALLAEKIREMRRRQAQIPLTEVIEMVLAGGLRAKGYLLDGADLSVGRL